jgi:hypothetical protein
VSFTTSVVVGHTVAVLTFTGADVLGPTRAFQANCIFLL